MMTDTCSAICALCAEGHQGGRDRFGQAGALPAGDHRRARPGSARVEDCIDAALTGRWNGGLHEPSTRCATHKIVLHGRKVVGGVRRGRGAGHARHDLRLGRHQSSATGTVIERRHELRGSSFKDKVLVFPGAKGSSGWSRLFPHDAAHRRRAEGA